MSRTSQHPTLCSDTLAVLVAVKKIVSVGYPIPHDNVEELDITSHTALLDADIILFCPALPVDMYSRPYQGKRCYSERGSAEIRDARDHWRRQLNEAIAAHKTVVLLLDSLEEVFVETGEVQVSGTGRNAQRTTMVTPANNYEMIPFSLGQIVNAKGRSMALKNNNRLEHAFRQLSDHLEYRVYVEKPQFAVLVETRSGGKAVGGLLRFTNGGSAIVFPFVDYDEDDWYEEDEDNSLTSEGRAFGGKWIAALLALEEVCRSERALTPAPDWTRASSYRFAIEEESDVRIAELYRKIKFLQEEITQEKRRVEDFSSLRRLLYEKGMALEEVVRETLVLMGFEVSHFKEQDSEFDALFSSEEGRFLGEFEGKDDKAINIDKISQLERNIQEDFEREEVTEHARGVLFGNAFRLIEMDKRGDFFTPKVHAAAKRAQIALIRTPDLFEAARYLKQSDDAKFARTCREAIAHGAGRVVSFPRVPGATLAPVNDSDRLQ